MGDEIKRTGKQPLGERWSLFGGGRFHLGVPTIFSESEIGGGLGIDLRLHENYRDGYGIGFEAMWLKTQAKIFAGTIGEGSTIETNRSSFAFIGTQHRRTGSATDSDGNEYLTYGQTKQFGAGRSCAGREASFIGTEGDVTPVPGTGACGWNLPTRTLFLDSEISPWARKGPAFRFGLGFEINPILVGDLSPDNRVDIRVLPLTIDIGFPDQAIDSEHTVGKPMSLLAVAHHTAAKAQALGSRLMLSTVLTQTQELLTKSGLVQPGEAPGVLEQAHVIALASGVAGAFGLSWAQQTFLVAGKGWQILFVVLEIGGGILSIAIGPDLGSKAAGVADILNAAGMATYALFGADLPSEQGLDTPEGRARLDLAGKHKVVDDRMIYAAVTRYAISEALFLVSAIAVGSGGQQKMMAEGEEQQQQMPARANENTLWKMLLVGTGSSVASITLNPDPGGRGFIRDSSLPFSLIPFAYAVTKEWSGARGGLLFKKNWRGIVISETRILTPALTPFNIFNRVADAVDPMSETVQPYQSASASSEIVAALGPARKGKWGHLAAFLESSILFGSQRNAGIGLGAGADVRVPFCDEEEGEKCAGFTTGVRASGGLQIGGEGIGYKLEGLVHIGFYH